MIVLYQFAISPFCDKIRRVLHLKKLPYEVREVPLLETFTALRKVNPIGKVPCLDDDGHLVADSTDVAHYLEERYPTPRLIPTAPRERALCHMLEDWADESLYFHEVRMRFTFPNNAGRTLAMLTELEPPFVRRAARFIIPKLMQLKTNEQGIGRKPAAMVIRDLERHVDAIDARLDGAEWLVGDAPTLADLSVFAQMFCIRGTDEGGPIIAARPAVAAWMDRVDRASAA